MKRRDNFGVLLPVIAIALLIAANRAAADEAVPHGTPFISPDGTLVAYSLHVVGPGGTETPRIVISRLDGTERRALEVPHDPDEIYWLAADRLAYSPQGDATWYEVISPAGESLAQLRLPDGCDVLYKRLSPDGELVAYVGSFDPNKADKASREHGLFVVDVGAHDVRRVLDVAIKSAPAWSPDSRRLAVGAAAGYVREYPLVVVDVRSGQVEALGCQGVGAAWSPDGKQLAFTTKILRGGSWRDGVPMDGSLGVWNLETKELRVVSPRASNHHDDDGWHLVGSYGPAWSRDGRRVAYRHQKQVRSSPESTTRLEVWVADLAEEAARQETGRFVLAEPVGEMAFAPDNSTLVWVASGRLGHVDTRVAAAPPPAEPAETRSGRFCVYGTVTDEQGRPLPGAKITVARGFATLFPSDPITSDQEGKYEIRFDASHRAKAQVALIHAAKEGYYDRDLGAAGYLGMSEDVVDDPAPYVSMLYPGRRYRLDFVMFPAAQLRGRLVDAAGQPLADYQIEIDGDTYPASNVLTSLTTDAQGNFAFDSLPLREYVFQLGHRHPIRSEPVPFDRAGPWHVELVYDALAATLVPRTGAQ